MAKRVKGLVAGLCLASLAGPLQAENAADANTDNGKALYQRYCATCHGLGLQGDGPTAAVLTVPPPDLTQVQAQNGGVFPLQRLVHRIDGREALIAHGSPMPIYGAFFEGDDLQRVDTAEGEVSTSQPVLEIIRYLRSLQR